MLNLEANKQEIDSPNNDILQVVFALGVLKLNVQTVLDTDVHLDAAIHLGRDAVAVDPNVLFADDVGHASRYGHAYVVSEFDVDAVVGFVLLLHVLEVEVESLGVLQLARGGELLDEGQELVVVAAVKEHLCVMRNIIMLVPSDAIWKV